MRNTNLKIWTHNSATFFTRSLPQSRLPRSCFRRVPREGEQRDGNKRPQAGEKNNSVPVAAASIGTGWNYSVKTLSNPKNGQMQTTQRYVHTLQTLTHSYILLQSCCRSRVPSYLPQTPASLWLFALRWKEVLSALAKLASMNKKSSTFFFNPVREK